MELTHINKKGEAEMVDISTKKIVHREASAFGKIYLAADTLDLIKNNQIGKGDVISVARIAGISGSSRCEVRTRVFSLPKKSTSTI